jgi:MYXO-CTERM domain-containing protein
MRSPLPTAAAVAAGSLVSFASIAGAAVTTTNVAATVTLSGTGGSQSFSAAIKRQSGIADTGTLMGQFGANTPIKGRWSAQLVGGAGGGANGGNVYAITVQMGSILQVGPFAQTYTQPIALSTDLIGGSVVTGASIGFGVGGGGLVFDDFGGANQILIDNSGLYGDANYNMRVDPNFEPNGILGNPSLMNTYATVAADGSVGFITSFNVSSLYVGIADVSALFNGNLAENQIRGFNSSFFVEVVSVPAPGAVALFGLAGLAGRRRRR